MTFIHLQDGCRLQGRESDVTSRSERTSVVVTNSRPVAVEPSEFEKWAFGVCPATFLFSERRSTTVQPAFSFVGKSRPNVAVLTYPSRSVEVRKESRYDLNQVYKRFHIHCLHSFVLRNPPTSFLGFVRIPARRNNLNENAKRNDSKIVRALSLERRRKVYANLGSRFKLPRRRKVVCCRKALSTEAWASPCVRSAIGHYDMDDCPWTRIWKYALIRRCGSYRRWLVPNRNNNADSKDDEDESDSDEDEEDPDPDLDKDKKKVERKVLFWHIFMLIISLLLLGLGLVLLFGFSPYVRHIITTFPGYHNYGHFVNLAYEPKELRFGELTNTLGILLIILNAAYIVCQVVYVSALVHRNPFTLPMITLLTGVVVMVEVSMINIYMSPVVAMNDEATFALKDKLVKSYAIYDTNIFSVTYDIIAIWGHCCGIINQYDFQTMLLKYRQGGVPRLLQVPPTCCKESIFINGITAVVECAVRAEEIYPIGCYSMLFNWLLFYCNLYSMVVIIQLLDMAIHVLLYKRRVGIIKRLELQFNSPVFDSWLSTGNV